MAPTVLRHTPHDAELVDRTGIIAASQAGRHDALADDAAGTARRVTINRSGMASMTAAVLMFVVAFTTVFDGRLPSGPTGGGAAREPAVIAAPSERPEDAEKPGQRSRPPAKPGKPRPKPAPAPEPEPEPDTTVLAESAPAPVAKPAEEESAEPPAQPRTDPVPDARVDLPRGGDLPGYSRQVREFIEPMMDLYEQRLDQQRSSARSADGDYSPQSDSARKWESDWFSLRGW